jgi:hypothetical protein
MGIVAGKASEKEFWNNGNHLLLSAVVVSVDNRRPGAGFYELAERLVMFNSHGRKPNPDGLNELTFWNDQVNKIVAKYGRK